MRLGRPLFRAAGALLNLAYPQDCIACGGETDGGAICAKCDAAMPRIGAWQCPRCGDELGPYSAGRPACPSCARRTGLVFRAAVAACRYEGPAREIVHRLKYGSDLRAVAVMTGELLPRLRNCPWADDIEVVAPAPLHWTRRLGRRFNQSELLAAGIAKALGKEYRPGILRRVRRTAAQAFLRGTAREENVRGAFAARKALAVEGRAVLLVDDVMTTCATASECARALASAGARRVYVAVFAR